MAFVVPCRDERGRRQQLTIKLSGDRVSVVDPRQQGWSLTPLQAGRLRRALQEAVLR
ncbi:hypothetical protein SAMN02982918_2662 [Saccharomonospora viridis]|nr:hypothetical protein SAMN02982918_2662 [Saccharomonospora viridis]